MKIVKLQYLNFCLLLIFAAGTVKADVFKSTSGRFFRDYIINQVTHDRVEVFHADGCTWLPHEELPPHILRQYSRVIAQKKARYNQRLEATIREKIEQARYEETSQQAVTMLLEIKKQYPSHPLIKEVDELIAAKGKEVAWEKNFITICSSGSIEEQIFQLQSLRDENPEADKNIVRKINAAIESRKKSLQDSVNRIAAAISAASALEDHEQAIAGLKSVLKKYPAYPIFEQQSSYLDKVNQLIADREQILAEDRQKISDRLTSFFGKNPDIQEQLKNLFMHDDSDTFDRQLGENILRDTIQLSETFSRAKSQNPETCVHILEKSLAEKYNYAINREQVKQYVSKIKQQLQEERQRLARLAELERQRKKQLAAIEKIHVTRGINGQFVIKKELNKDNDWELLIIPACEKENAQMIYNLYDKASQYRRERNKNNKLADEYHAKGIYFYEAAASYRSMATKDNDRYMEAKSNANKMLSSLRQSLKSYDISGTVCSLSNLETNVVLLATESFFVHNVPVLGAEEVTNCWYEEYTPGQSGNYWTLK